jgi:nucleoside diphosphate kinase
MGEIISRFERIGLKPIAGKLIHADREMVGRHYPEDRTEWIASLGKR